MWYIAALLIGGFIGIATMCMVQIGRANELYIAESRLNRIKQTIDNLNADNLKESVQVIEQILTETYSKNGKVIV